MTPFNVLVRQGKRNEKGGVLTGVVLCLREAKGLVNWLDVFNCSPWLYAWTECSSADGETQES